MHKLSKAEVMREVKDYIYITLGLIRDVYKRQSYSCSTVPKWWWLHCPQNTASLGSYVERVVHRQCLQMCIRDSLWGQSVINQYFG